MGEVFAGRYEFVDPIGEGGMGTVWRVWDHTKDEMVAAKVLRQSDAGMLVRFVREQALRIAHPHVLMPQGWAGMDDRVLFTMPVVAGGSLATLVGDFGPLPPLVVAELLRQLLDALAVVHDHQIVHRDIKPANILLDATGRDRPHAYLGDFGIALDTRAPRWTESGVITGTPGYLAPELIRAGAPTPAADLYAVGQLAMTMLTGLGPGDDPHRSDPDVVAGEPVTRGVPLGCPTPLIDLVGELLALDPRARPPSARVAADRLRDPLLAWTEAAIGDIEIFDQLPPLPPPWGPQADPETPPAEALLARPVVDVAPTERQPPGRTASEVGARPAAPPPVKPSPRSAKPSPPRPRRFVVAGVAALVAVLIGGGWLALANGDPADPTGVSSSAPVTPSTTAPAGIGSPTTPAPSPSASSGSVSVGQVVVSVGQACEFTDVGILEHTVDGVAVQCARQNDGTYQWVVPPAP